MSVDKWPPVLLLFLSWAPCLCQRHGVCWNTTLPWCLSFFLSFCGSGKKYSFARCFVSSGCHGDGETIVKQQSFPERRSNIVGKNSNSPLFPSSGVSICREFSRDQSCGFFCFFLKQSTGPTGRQPTNFGRQINDSIIRAFEEINAQGVLQDKKTVFTYFRDWASH